MSDLSTKERNALRKDQFAYVDREGEEHLPIHDESHVRNAIARFNQTDFESKAAKERARKKILAAAERHGIEVDEDGTSPSQRTDRPRSALRGRHLVTVVLAAGRAARHAFGIVWRLRWKAVPTF